MAWLSRLAALGAVLLHGPANAEIAVDHTHKILILHGYSMELRQQELTLVHPLLTLLLPPFATDLERALRGKVEYMSDGVLNKRLESAGLSPKDERREQAIDKKDEAIDKKRQAIDEYLRRGNYTHLITADVTMITQASGVVLMQIGALPRKERPLEVDEIRGVKVETSQSSADLDDIRRGLVTEFLRKFRRQDTEKIIRIGCIAPQIRGSNDKPDRTELSRLNLEVMLSPELTNMLNELHRSEKMIKGYSPKKIYNIDPLGKCIMSVKSDEDIGVNVVDYDITGKIIVAYAGSGEDQVEVRVDVIRYIPNRCARVIPLRETFPPTKYSEKQYFIDLSEQKLLVQYKPQWTDLEKKPCRF